MANRKKQLLAMKYNQRSQMQFEFMETGRCGPKGKLWETLPRVDQASKKESDPSYLEDPAGENHLYWVQPPEMVLVIKKFKDVSVTQKFKELTKWLVEEKHLKVTVEPSVLNEREVSEDTTFMTIKDSFVTWVDDDKDYMKKVLDEVDLIICIGGDGTLLYTSSLFQENLPPIMSFHMGSLGFLTPFQFSSQAKEDIADSEASYQQCIERVLKGGVSLTLRHRLECKIKTVDSVSTVDKSDMCPLSPNDTTNQFTALYDHGKLSWSREKETSQQMLVMNDLVVDRGPNPYLTNLLIKCNGRPMTTVQGDEDTFLAPYLVLVLGFWLANVEVAHGIIIATPTGSTAYSLAAGASMVHPSVPCIVVTPICPHSLSFRSIVVPSGVELEITLNPSARNSAWVSFDGRNRQEISKGDSVIVSTCKWPVPSINNTGHVTDWFDSLAECLHWNVRKEQKKM